MPIKKPKPVKLPTPFKDLSESPDDDTRRRAILMKREMERTEGFSWNRPQERGFSARIRSTPRRMLFGVAAAAMGLLVVASLIFAGNTGFVPSPTIIYANSWSAKRTTEDAVADREEAMADYFQRYAAQEDALAKENSTAEAQRSAGEARRLAAEAQQRAEAARAAAIAREKAAARGATPGN